MTLLRGRKTANEMVSETCKFRLWDDRAGFQLSEGALCFGAKQSSWTRAALSRLHVDVSSGYFARLQSPARPQLRRPRYSHTGAPMPTLLQALKHEEQHNQAKHPDQSPNAYRTVCHCHTHERQCATQATYPRIMDLIAALIKRQTYMTKPSLISSGATGATSTPLSLVHLRPTKYRLKN